MKNYDYAIYRHGSNSANQSMVSSAIVCSVSAPNRSAAIDEALRLAEEDGRFTLYANQSLSAIPWSKVSCEDAEQLAIEEQIVKNVCCLICGKNMGNMERWKADNAYCGCQN